MQFVAHAQIERQLRADLEVVHGEEVIGPAVPGDLHWREGPGCRGRDTQQEVGIRIAGEAIGEPDFAEKVVAGSEVVPFVPDQLEAELQIVPALKPAQVVLEFLGVGPVPLLSPRILVQARHTVAEGQSENAVDVRKIRGQANQPEILHQLETMLR